MRPGEIVRFDYDNIGRVAIIEYENDARQEGVQLGDLCRLEGHPCWITVDSLEIVTVAELFEAAGHPVPDESYLVLEEMNRYGVCAWLAVHSTGTTLHFRSLNGEIGWRSSARSNAPPYSLSRLPALDAWDALPECVKAVVK